MRISSLMLLVAIWLVLWRLGSSNLEDSQGSPHLLFSHRISGSELEHHMMTSHGDEVSLQRALNLVQKDSREYASVLFYASWCPFSKTLRPNFTILSSLFPTIHHFAFEESSIRPSILSRYGVHGFPTLFLLNCTTRVRYHGPRTLDSLVRFYNGVTGIKPASLDRTSFEKIWDQLNPIKLEDAEQECPFSWARSPEKLLRQETYLALATAFVLLRLFYFLLPTLLACIKRAWRRRMRNASLMQLWEHPQIYLEHGMQVFSRMKPCKRSNLQEGAMNAKAWASKSLASVAIGEASSSRACFGNERR
ncbi:5'-adenylylsulfate reductase-like 3 isoform X2 [Magnolia sinica]|uniref:5'-adenylylsulfate reductase-like 3 isoform X2 n=1 Tax=Magnolia sinica TaxID=86752 RepID=UPI00265AD6F5|nr:5'-adenylylsulfate reductase-like 3 isoform X2 [Magnolia sinica]